ncbi:MAG: hypothetical protein JW785_07350 [Acidimicrobiia bacterium]|nr:hypothetical protein [Acidimicrobiia bacterium]
MRGGRIAVALAVLALGVGSQVAGQTEAAFRSAAGAAGSSFVAAPDFVAPTVVRTRVADPSNPPSYQVRQCRFYQAYAEVTDSGNPASGVTAVSANLSALSGGAGAEALSAGAFSLDGVSYGFLSRPLLATADPGTYDYSLTSTDQAANARVETGLGALVEAGSGAVDAVFLTGLEQGVASASLPGVFDSVTGAGVNADATVARHGSHSLRVAPANAAAFATADLGGSGNTVVVRFAVRLASLPGATVNLFAVSPGGGATVSTAIFLYDAAAGVFAVRWGMSGTVVPGNSAPVPGAWHLVEMRVSVADPHVLEWRIDAVEQPTASAANPAQSVVAINFGTGVTNVTYTAHFDDIIVSPNAADYPIGNGKVLGLAIDGAGSHSQPNRFRNNGGSNIDASSWTRVDDIPADTTADFVFQRNAVATRYLEFTFADTTEESCINAVSALLAYHSAGTAANNGKASIFNGATETVVYSGDMSVTSLAYARAVVSPGGGAWAPAALNGLVARVGYSTDVNPNPYWDALLLEYDVPLAW